MRGKPTHGITTAGLRRFDHRQGVTPEGKGFSFILILPADSCPLWFARRLARGPCLLVKGGQAIGFQKGACSMCTFAAGMYCAVPRPVPRPWRVGTGGPDKTRAGGSRALPEVHQGSSRVRKNENQNQNQQ